MLLYEHKICKVLLWINEQTQTSEQTNIQTLFYPIIVQFSSFSSIFSTIFRIFSKILWNYSLPFNYNASQSFFTNELQNDLQILQSTLVSKLNGLWF